MRDSHLGRRTVFLRLGRCPQSLILVLVCYRGNSGNSVWLFLASLCVPRSHGSPRPVPLTPADRSFCVESVGFPARDAGHRTCFLPSGGFLPVFSGAGRACDRGGCRVRYATARRRADGAPAGLPGCGRDSGNGQQQGPGPHRGPTEMWARRFFVVGAVLCVVGQRQRWVRTCAVSVSSMLATRMYTQARIPSQQPKTFPDNERPGKPRAPFSLAVR